MGREGNGNAARVKINSRWYIVRHWRGDLSLAVSYWFSGLFVSVLIPAIGLLVIAALENHDHKLNLALFLGLRGFLIVGQVWLAVGIWRAASRHGARSGQRRWASLAKLAVAIGAFCAITEFASAAIPDAAKLYTLSGGPFGDGRR